MSRKPETPTDDAGPAGTGQELTEIDVGPRFTGSEEILRIERELAAAGVDLPNRAIPIEYHVDEREYARGEVTELIESELEKEAPNRNLIGYLNTLNA